MPRPFCDDRNQLREQIVTSVLRSEREIKIKFPIFIGGRERTAIIF